MIAFGVPEILESPQWGQGLKDQILVLGTDNLGYWEAIVASVESWQGKMSQEVTRVSVDSSFIMFGCCGEETEVFQTFCLYTYLLSRTFKWWAFASASIPLSSPREGGWSSILTAIYDLQRDAYPRLFIVKRGWKYYYLVIIARTT